MSITDKEKHDPKHAGPVAGMMGSMPAKLFGDRGMPGTEHSATEAVDSRCAGDLGGSGEPIRERSNTNSETPIRRPLRTDGRKSTHAKLRGGNGLPSC